MIKRLIFPLLSYILSTVLYSGQEAVLENSFMRVRIISRGGKIAELYDKGAQRELLVSEPSLLSGAGKSREILFNSIETLTADFQLQRLDQRTVRVGHTCEHGPIAGMELIRIYRLEPDQVKLKIREIWRSREQPNQLHLNWHNSFRWQTGDTVFYLPSQRGLIEVDRALAKINKLNLVQDVGEAWMAAFDGEYGVALRFDNAKAIAGLQIWAAENLFTLEADFKEVNLTPTAAMDEWEISGEIILLRGRGRLQEIVATAVLTSDDEQYSIFFAEDFGVGEVFFNGERKKINAAAGSILSLSKIRPAFPIRISTDSGEISFAPPIKDTSIPPQLPLTRKPVRELPGINGFYYFYPKLYLSSELGTEIAFGLRGDFSKTKNFRFAILLPEEVFFAGGEPVSSVKSQVTVEGQPYCRYEIPSPYKSTRSACSWFVMQVSDSFRSGKKAYFQGVWDVGEQPLQELTLEKVASFPELGAGLKHFRVALGTRSTFNWPPEYRRFGVNHVEIWDDTATNFHNAYHGKAFYHDRIREAGEAGLTCSIELGTPFSRAHSVAQGKMLEGAGRLFHPEHSDLAVQLPEFLAVDHRGQTVPQLCPSYRGRYFEKTLDVVKTSLDYGFEEIAYDDETWTNGRTICFCSRCQAAFGKTVSDPDADGWWEFKTDQVADIYRRIREVLGETKRMTVWLASSVNENYRYGAITQRLTDYRKIGQYVDQIWPMYYTADSESVGGLAGTIASMLKGKRAKLVMGLAPNRYYEYFRVHSGNFASLDAVSSQMLESCFEGAVGVSFWGHRGSFRGAHDYLQIAQAAKALLPVEEIILRGECVPLNGSNPAVKVTAYRHLGQYAIFLRYYGRETLKTELQLPGEAVDTLTGDVIGNPFVFGDRRTYVLWCQSGR